MSSHSRRGSFSPSRTHRGRLSRFSLPPSPPHAPPSPLPHHVRNPVGKASRGGADRGTQCVPTCDEVTVPYEPLNSNHQSPIGGSAERTLKELTHDSVYSIKFSHSLMYKSIFHWLPMTINHLAQFPQVVMCQESNTKRMEYMNNYASYKRGNINDCSMKIIMTITRVYQEKCLQKRLPETLQPTLEDTQYGF